MLPRALAALALLLAPAPAMAHGGRVADVATAGPYRVELEARLVQGGEVPVVDASLRVRDRRSGGTVPGLRLRVSGSTPRGSLGSVRPRQVRGAFDVLLPAPREGEWTRYRLHVGLRGPQGAAAVTLRPRGVPGGVSFDPAPVACAALLAVLFLGGFVRLRRRRRALAPLSRAWLLAAAVAVGLGAVLSPLDALGEGYLLSAHMLQHVLLGDLAPALLVLALRGPLCLFLLPRRVLRPLARSLRVRAALRFLLRPAATLGLWGAVFYAWHVPALYDAALRHPVVHDLEHLSFALAGLVLWVHLIDPAHRREARRTRRLAVAFGAFFLGLVLSDWLLFSFSVHYEPYAAQPDRLLGLSPLQDQRLAGVVMTVEQLLTLGPCIAWLLAGVARERRARPLAAGVPHEARA